MVLVRRSGVVRQSTEDYGVKARASGRNCASFFVRVCFRLKMGVSGSMVALICLPGVGTD